VPPQAAFAPESGAKENDAQERFEVHMRKSHNRLLRGVTMVTKVAAHVTQMQRVANVVARRHVAADGSVDYDVIAKEGDKTVLREMIGRFIGTEIDAHNHRGDEIAITPANYKFKLKMTRQDGGRELDIFEVHPRKRRVGLFKGEVWVDTATGLTVHENGVWVKSPSVFLKNVRFAREYEIRDGYAIPKSTTILTQTRLWGLAELTVEYSDVTWDAAVAASQN
jgi:hypothetical protein